MTRVEALQIVQNAGFPRLELNGRVFSGRVAWRHACRRLPGRELLALLERIRKMPTRRQPGAWPIEHPIPSAQRATTSTPPQAAEQRRTRPNGAVLSLFFCSPIQPTAAQRRVVDQALADAEAFGLRVPTITLHFVSMPGSAWGEFVRFRREGEVGAVPYGIALNMAQPSSELRRTTLHEIVHAEQSDQGVSSFFTDEVLEQLAIDIAEEIITRFGA